MSTRCNIVATWHNLSTEGKLIPMGQEILYVHHDGYPDRVGEQLNAFIKSVCLMGCGGNSKLAYLAFLGYCYKEGMRYKLESVISGDIEYLYEINFYMNGNAVIEVYEVVNNGKTLNTSLTKKYEI